MPNTVNPKQSRRRLLVSIANSTLLQRLFGLAHCLRKLCTQCNLFQGEVGCRTVSCFAICVMAGILPTGILSNMAIGTAVQAGYRSGHYCNKNTGRIAKKWQDTRDASQKGRWTHCLILDIKMFTTRKYGQVVFYFTQLLTRHGCFRAYLYCFVPLVLLL